MSMKERTSLEIYVDELKNNNCSTLKIEEELELLKLASKGDKEAINKIINANLRFVISVAKKYAKFGSDIEDLIQVGNIALFESFDSFDYDKFIKSGCNRFISYAGRRIAQKIILESKNNYAVSLKDGKFKQLKSLQNEMSNLDEEMDELTKVEIASKNIGISKKAGMQIYNASMKASSLDFIITDDEKTFGERIADETFIQPAEEAIMNIMSEEVKEKITTLPQLEKDVLTLSYGLNGTKPLNYPTIGKQIGYTREGVRVIHNRAIEHLKEQLAA